MESIILDDTIDVSPSVGDYLKAVYRLEQSGQHAETSRLGEALGGIKPSSVTAMIKRLAEAGLLEYVPYRGVSLTAKGRKISLRVLRKHRLLELFLVKELGFSWEDVHEEAEVLEHHLSPRLVDRIEAKLGHPEFDPHGDPIPGADGVVPARETIALSDCSPGREMVVFRVLDQSHETLAFYRERALVPGAAAKVIARDSESGTILVSAGGREVRMDARAAAKILMIRSEG
jgi:DtxR family transcriptional regulator, Mn-dependent transcriptional regulator